MRIGDVTPMRGTVCFETASVTEPSLGSMVAPTLAARLALMMEQEAPVSNWAMCLCALMRMGTKICGPLIGSPGPIGVRLLTSTCLTDARLMGFFPRLAGVVSPCGHSFA